jgi:SHS2 domain-containing protein
MKRFKILDHTADIGLIVYGQDLKSLFENAAAGFLHLITDLRKVKVRTTRQIRIEPYEEENLERLMVDWLGELLYLHDTENLLFKRFSVEYVGKEGLKGAAEGEPFRNGVHIIKTEVKAVTYHGIKVEQEEGKWKARVIFDL